LGATWVSQSKQTQYDRAISWSRSWAQSVTDDFKSGVGVVREYQRQRQTLYEVLIISLLVGVLGNVLVQQLFPYPTIISNATKIQSTINLQIVGLIVCLMAISVAAFFWNQKRYGPKQPAEIFLTLDYPTLFESYGDKERDHLDYLMTGTGILDFEDFAKRVLERMQGYLEAAPFQCKCPNSKISKRKYDDDSPPDVIMSIDLKELAIKNNVESVQARMSLMLYASLFSHDPIRTNGVSLRIVIRVTNPTNPFADDFLTQVIEPMLPFMAQGFSISFWAILLGLSPLPEVRGLIKRVHDYKIGQGKADDWYLIDYFPYDGKSHTMIVVDKALVNREWAESVFYEEPINSVMRQTSLFGSYVTDCDDWLSARTCRRLVLLSPHLLDEMILVKPTTLITIGAEAKRYARRGLRKWESEVKGRIPPVVNLLENMKRPPPNYGQLRNLLQAEIKEKLPSLLISDHENENSKMIENHGPSEKEHLPAVPKI